MSSLYRKYRPQNFSQISGQESIVKTLSRSIEKGRISHAYLFAGSRGTGKTTLARIFAKAINCLQPVIDQKKLAVLEPCGSCASCQKIASGKNLDILEIDAASNTGVDNIRSLKENVNTPPASLKYKVYIIDEVHMLSGGAFNALLKTLEEPPKHAIFILATTENHKIPETITSRCQRFDFLRLSLQQIIDRLRQIAEKEKVSIEEEALNVIAFEAEGGMRDAESLLGQIISLEDKNITTKETEQILGIASGKVLIEFVEKLLIEKNASQNLFSLEKLTQKGLDLKNFEKSLFFFLRELLIFKTNPHISQENIFRSGQKQIEALEKIAQKTTAEEIIELLDLLGKNYSLHKNSPLPSLPLELSVIEFCLEKKTAEPRIVPDAQNAKIPLSPMPTCLPDRQVGRQAPFSKGEDIPKSSLSSVKEIPAPLPEKKEMPVDREKKSSPKISVSIEEFIGQWPKLLEEVKPFNHSIHAFLKNCVPCRIENEKVIIKTRYAYHQTKLNQPECRLTVHSSIAKLFPGGLQVQFVFDKNLPIIEKPSGEKEETASLEEKETEEDLLFETMRDLGGQIVEEEKGEI